MICLINHESIDKDIKNWGDKDTNSSVCKIELPIEFIEAMKK